MTFPTVAGSATSTDEDGDATVTVTLPGSIAAGDLIIAYVYARSSVNTLNPTTPTGYTQLDLSQGAIDTFVSYYKVAAGGETSISITFDNLVDQSAAAVAYRITGYQGTPESTAASGSGTTPDPPNLAPSWGADDNLWLANAACLNVTADLAAPTNYGNLLQPITALGGQMGSARRELNAASENPGTFANANNATWRTSTSAVRGQASGAAAKMDNYRRRRAA